VIVGAGFIGQEVAAAAARAGVQATIVEAADAPLQALLGTEVGAWFAQLHRSQGVEVLLGAGIVAAHGTRRVDALTLRDGRRLACDHVVVGIGVDPDLGWLAGSGLDTTGVTVDADGRSAAPDVFAAGDAAATYDPILRRHVPGGHWESAARQGVAAARAMLGHEPQRSAPASFWSDLYDTRVQYLGNARIADRTAIDGDPAARDFTITFSRDGAPVVVLLVGRPTSSPTRERCSPPEDREEHDALHGDHRPRRMCRARRLRGDRARDLRHRRRRGRRRHRARRAAARGRADLPVGRDRRHRRADRPAGLPLISAARRTR
jgi:3-phenylpropionate/trans-cinnamate dioxygenase ferredoxin reductase component